MTIHVQEPGKLNPILNDLAIGADLKDRMPPLQALLTSKHVLVDVLKDLGQLEPDTDVKTMNIRVGNLGKALTSNLIGAELIELKLRGPQPDGLGKTLSAVGARFMEHVVAPTHGSVDSSESFLLICGLIGGVALGAGLATVFEVLDPRLRRVKDFEEASGRPVLAFIPRIEPA